MSKHKIAATAIVTVGTALYYLAPNVSAADLALRRQNAKVGPSTTATAAAYELVPARRPSEVS